jgi:hypothetical protein
MIAVLPSYLMLRCFSLDLSLSLLQENDWVMRFQVCIVGMQVRLQEGTVDHLGAVLSPSQAINATGGVTSVSGIPKFMPLDYTFILEVAYRTFVTHPDFGPAYIQARSRLLTKPDGSLMGFGQARRVGLGLLKPLLSSLVFKPGTNKKLGVKMVDCSFFRMNGTYYVFRVGAQITDSSIKLCTSSFHY